MTSKTASNTSAASYSESAPSPERKARQALVLLAQSAAVPVLSLIALFAVWEAVVRVFDLPVFLLPAPSVIWQASTEQVGTLFGHTVVTLRTVLYGFFVSVLISLPLAVVITSSQWLANVIYPVLVLTQSIPKVALAPILVIALGANELPRIVVTFLVAFFPLVIAVATGLMSAPKELIELGRSYRGSGWQILMRIKLPFAVPMIFSGLNSMAMVSTSRAFSLPAASTSASQPASRACIRHLAYPLMHSVLNRLSSVKPSDFRIAKPVVLRHRQSLRPQMQE